MSNENRITFDRFRLDLPNECLWEGSQAIKLRPKAFGVLDYLLGRPGQLVTKDELLQAVWPGTFVGDGVLKVVIRQLRDILGDDPKAPRFIETAHRRGYRFIGAIAAPPHTGPTATPHSSLNTAAPPQTVVGREEALSRMRTCLHKTLRGERQVLFITGEAGIGKTALVDAFVQSLVFDGTIWTARGQCFEQYGTSEAYLPVLEAIGRLCREHTQILDVLRTNAPMWMLQLPSLLSASDREVLSRQMSGATHERMLREMGGTLEALTADRPLVLILEDLHWSDYSTLDLISYLARQPQSAPLMLIGTYRTADVIVRGHPLNAVKRELLAKRQCEELPLEDLSEEMVANYLAVRFPGNRFPTKLAASIHQRTDGNPLFMVNAVDYLIAEKSIDLRENSWEFVVDIENVKVGVPDSIKHMIEKQIDHLDVEEQRTLEVASIAGTEFSIAAVAAGLEEDASAVEARFYKLARRHQFIHERDVVEIPEGATVAGTASDTLYMRTCYMNAYRRRAASRCIDESLNVKRIFTETRSGESPRNWLCISNGARITGRRQSISSMPQKLPCADLHIKMRSHWQAGAWNCSKDLRTLQHARSRNYAYASLLACH